MQRDTLAEILKEADGKPVAESSFRFEGGHGLSLLVTAGSALLTIDKVRDVSLKSGYMKVETGRGERYFVDLERLVGVRSHSSSESAGFTT